MRRERQGPDGVARVLDEREAIAAELERLWRAPRAARRRTDEAVGTTGRAGAGLLEVPARNVEHGFDEEIALVVPQLEEVDFVGVSQEPRGFVIE
jgi:hypothetical protein